MKIYIVAKVNWFEDEGIEIENTKVFRTLKEAKESLKASYKEYKGWWDKNELQDSVCNLETGEFYIEAKSGYSRMIYRGRIDSAEI